MRPRARAPVRVFLGSIACGALRVTEVLSDRLRFPVLRPAVRGQSDIHPARDVLSCLQLRWRTLPSSCHATLICGQQERGREPARETRRWVAGLLGSMAPLGPRNALVPCALLHAVNMAIENGVRVLFLIFSRVEVCSVSFRKILTDDTECVLCTSALVGRLLDSCCVLCLAACGRSLALLGSSAPCPRPCSAQDAAYLSLSRSHTHTLIAHRE
mmetsp:Transcript_27801/g.89840  ORF Transcript_27801/g.89840 Transcript_27801/m.89840 type:complete len:214 (-) Transcript_27801:37-678(-)|eukprot:scaffold6644_cov123-Isochrysis_galbana.AAC.1